MERSKLVDKNVYIKWYNISKDEIKNEILIPERTKEDIFELISRENWLMFCEKQDNKEIAIQKPEPNIYFDVLSKEGNLTGFGRLGLTFNNVGAYKKFRTIMRGINKEVKDKITEELLKLKYNWEIKVHRKIKEHNYAQTPEYKLEGIWDTKQINENIIDDIIRKANKIKEDGESHRIDRKPKYYSETPTIRLMEAEFRLNEEEFRDRISEIFKVLTLCLGVKSDVEINKIIRYKIKELTEKREKLERIIKELPKEKMMIGVVSQFTEETIKQKEAEKEKLEKEVRELEEEIEG